MEKIIRASLEIPASTRYIAYGTAGFRTLASDLPQVFFRSGLVALLRASETSKFIGIMVTASHNQIQDNGLKMVDYNGEMLPISWEKTAESIANAEDLSSTLQEKWSDAINGTILIGYDNRPSSVGLVDCIKSAITAAGSSFHDYGLVTTPQFHYLVNQCNLLSSIAPSELYLQNLQAKVNAVCQIRRRPAI